jgi:signal transduction histidine kinase
MVLAQNRVLEEKVEKRTLELADVNSELRHRFNQLKEFNFITAHNLRAPVANIVGLAQLFNEKNLPDPVNKDVIVRIRKSSNELDEIIHDLGKILETQGRSLNEFKMLDIEPIIDRVLNRYTEEVTKRKIKVIKDFEINRLFLVEDHFEKIISNLMSNAIRFLHVPEPEIYISIKPVDNEFIMIFQDNGIGFDSDRFSAKLFQPFQKFHDTSEGKGLGLYLVKRLVVAMRGRIKLEARINGGVTIQINFTHPPAWSFYKDQSQSKLILSSNFK